MRIVDVGAYVLKLPAERAYLGSLTDGTELTDADGYRVREPWRSLYSARYETVLVRITTDTGVSGWGEALAPVGPEVVAAIVDRLLAGWLIGRDPRGVRPLWSGMRDLMRERGHLGGHQADAMAAVDIALWDLHGQLTGLPVVELLGGAARSRIPVYVSGLPEPTDAARARSAADWVAAGATAVKLALGNGVAADLATFDAVQEAAPTLRIAVDAHWAYRLHEAVALGQELDRRGALFLEAPLAPEDIAGHADLAMRIRTPIAVGEAMRHRYEFRDWLGARALAMAQPDVARTGITEAMIISDLCSAHLVPIACHHSVGLGVALAAGLHVSAAAQDAPFFEFQPTTVPVSQRILRDPIVIGPTGADLPDGAGLGIDVDGDLVAALAEESAA